MELMYEKIFVFVAWILQTLLAISSALFFVVSAVLVLFFNGINTFALFYAFVTDVCLAAASAGIAYATIKQFRHRLSDHISHCRSELWKSALAGGMWLWLLLDAFFGPISQLGDGRFQQHRISNAATMILVPL
jgi:zinc transporter ZupT